MTVTKRRNRVVYFRVTADEFDQLDRLRETHGARSLSDIARLAIARMMEARNESADNGVSHRLEKIDHTLDALNLAIDRLANQLNGNGRGHEDQHE